MTFCEEVKDEITRILAPIADVTVEDHTDSCIAIVLIEKTGKVVNQRFDYGMGYAAKAREWAINVLATYGPRVQQPRD